ncbi:TM2 domain-containing protein [Williamsia limnetica]|uniref:TM2 domain-containing protein n=1 Tax=Williamsia limnetica TaxID=882452 RepID=A0A318RK06_WILLI|nr:TM2 domain-containing protein [Williamsia limnetica]
MSYLEPHDNSGSPEWQSNQPYQGSPGYPAPYEPPNPMYQAPAPYGQPTYGPSAFGPVAGFTGDPGAPFGRDPYTGEPLSDKSKVVAGLLQLFLGGFGAGRFYIGSNGIAIGQLCVDRRMGAGDRPHRVHHPVGTGHLGDRRCDHDFHRQRARFARSQTQGLTPSPESVLFWRAPPAVLFARTAHPRGVNRRSSRSDRSRHGFPG